MIPRFAVTVSLVPEAKGGPFILWGDLDASCRRARELGYDGIELFAPSPAALGDDLARCLSRHGLKLAGAGTGAGWVLHKLSLSSPDPEERSRARDFVRSIIDAAARHGAPAIIGSMQGRWGGAVTRDAALGFLAEAVADLAAHAGRRGVPLLVEPLNRYESNVLNTLEDASTLLEKVGSPQAGLLADAFHMNIEEQDLAGAVRAAGPRLRHVQFADSNRRPAGAGHTNFAAIVAALRGIRYEGWVSAEAVPWPDPDAAARRSIETFRTLFS